MRRRLAVPTKSMMMLGFSSAGRAWTTETSAHAARAAVRSMLGEFVAPFVVRVPSLPGIGNGTAVRILKSRFFG
jgi:hypothetical protein